MSETGIKKSPSDFDAVGVNWIVNGIGWPFPTWVEKEIYNEEFHSHDDRHIARGLVSMFNELGAAIEARFAAGGPGDVIEFKYWRKLNPKATKMKPLKLRATMYRNPDYDNPWILIEVNE